ncbi:MAG: glycosyltransferase family 39 protein [Clostridia bacterium]
MKTKIQFVKCIKSNLFLLIFISLYVFISCFFIFKTNYANFIFSLFAFGLLGILAAYWNINHTLNPKKIVFLIFACGLILRFLYITYTDLGVRQHDIGSFYKSGHSGYITYVYDNFKLPDFDVRTKWQFYQPPLHYFIAAAWLRLQTFFGLTYTAACENIQFITLIYSTVSLFFIYKILDILKLKNASLYVPFALAAFQPTFFFLAGSYNNDTLSVMFIILAFYYTLKWYYNRTLGNIILLALFIGLAMMSKLSSWYIAPAVALLFLLVLIYGKNVKKYIIQYAAFGAICLPLGLFWPLRNFIKFGVPINYVPLLRMDHEQYIGNYSVFSRIFNPFESLLESIYNCHGHNSGDLFFEYNIPAAVFKTSVFGEWQIGAESQVCKFFAFCLLYVNIALIVISIVVMIRYLFKKFENRDIKWFLYLFYVTIISGYIFFCFAYPHDCSMDFRYIVASFVIGIIFLGFYIRDTVKKGLKIALYALTSLFCVFSTCLYVSLALL